MSREEKTPEKDFSLNIPECISSAFLATSPNQFTCFSTSLPEVIDQGRFATNILHGDILTIITETFPPIRIDLLKREFIPSPEKEQPGFVFSVSNTCCLSIPFNNEGNNQQSKLQIFDNKTLTKEIYLQGNFYPLHTKMFDTNCRTYGHNYSLQKFIVLPRSNYVFYALEKSCWAVNISTGIHTKIFSLSADAFISMDFKEIQNISLKNNQLSIFYLSSYKNYGDSILYTHKLIKYKISLDPLLKAELIENWEVDPKRYIWALYPYIGASSIHSFWIYINLSNPKISLYKFENGSLLNQDFSENFFSSLNTQLTEHCQKGKKFALPCQWLPEGGLMIYNFSTGAYTFFYPQYKQIYLSPFRSIPRENVLHFQLSNGIVIAMSMEENKFHFQYVNLWIDVLVRVFLGEEKEKTTVIAIINDYLLFPFPETKNSKEKLSSLTPPDVFLTI